MLVKIIASAISIIAMVWFVSYCYERYERGYDRRYAQLVIKEKLTEQEEVEMIMLRLRHERNVAYWANRPRMYIYPR